MQSIRIFESADWQINVCKRVEKCRNRRKCFQIDLYKIPEGRQQEERGESHDVMRCTCSFAVWLWRALIISKCGKIPLIPRTAPTTTTRWRFNCTTRRLRMTTGSDVLCFFFDFILDQSLPAYMHWCAFEFCALCIYTIPYVYNYTSNRPIIILCHLDVQKETMLALKEKNTFHW